MIGDFIGGWTPKINLPPIDIMDIDMLNYLHIDITDR
jgi:hypothetical protein